MHFKNRNFLVLALLGISLRNSAHPIENIPAAPIVTASIPAEVWVTASVTVIEDDGPTITATAIEGDGATFTATDAEEDGPTFVVTNTEGCRCASTLPVTTAEDDPISTATATSPVTEIPEGGSTNIVQVLTVSDVTSTIVVEDSMTTYVVVVTAQSTIQDLPTDTASADTPSSTSENGEKKRSSSGMNLSDRIALGVGIGIGVPTFIATIWKCCR
ncbi:hypothetical protein B0T10DRAFT_544731 [Thelonectria olida]|uniref:Uncharacterized protein n=1 Tax=Thelonectria olida TaxID=1576542 RepID=A0A9P8WE93_9HYPO|nr:hypothetical protein B0T10DRAFT_544731 [Thelonectria olida]